MSKAKRLDAFLARAGYGSRSEIKKAIKSGKVKVDGEIVKQAPTKVTDENKIYWKDELVISAPETMHILMNKPIGFVCSHGKEEGKLVYDLLPLELQNISMETIGRLDKETSGLLLFTTDGKKLHRFISPKHNVKKYYKFTYTGELSQNAVEKCKEGIMIEEKRTLPSELIISENNTGELILAEGRYHQVRRMILALGGEITKLHRYRIADMFLPEKLLPGEFIELDELP